MSHAWDTPFTSTADRLKIDGQWGLLRAVHYGQLYLTADGEVYTKEGPEDPQSTEMARVDNRSYLLDDNEQITAELSKVAGALLTIEESMDTAVVRGKDYGELFNEIRDILEPVIKDLNLNNRYSVGGGMPLEVFRAEYLRAEKRAAAEFGSSPQIAYPITAEWHPHNGLIHSGFARTAEEARRIYAELMEDEDVGEAVLSHEECMTVRPDRLAAAEADWAEEIEAGWASIVEFGNSYRVFVDTWIFSEPG